MQNLGIKIRAAREQAKMSQLQVGVALGVSDKTISGYEADRICPPIDKLEQISDLLKKPITYFLDLDDRDFKVSSRLRAVELSLRDIRQELREIKIISQKKGLE